MNKPLPRNPDWRVCVHHSSRPCLTLVCGETVLHLRFWPRASALLRPGPDEPWTDGGPQAESLLKRYLRSKAYGELRMRGRIHPVGPEGQLYFPFIGEEVDTNPGTLRDRALAMAIDHIPAAVRRRLQELRTNRWAALGIASRIRAAAELLEAHPQLFWLWLRRHLPDPEAPRQLIRLKTDLSFPRRIQLAKLDFAPETFWLKLLAKVPLRQVHRIDWDGFAAFTRKPIDRTALKQLQHARKPPVSLLQALADGDIRRDLPVELVQDCIKHPSERFYQWLRQIQRLRERLPDGQELVTIPSSMKALGMRAESAGASLEAMRQARGKRAPSPFACPEGWSHLDTAEKLVEEGYRQFNCLRGNAADYLDKRAIVYRVERPVRATLRVAKGPGGQWYLRECLGRLNQDVSPKVRGGLLRELTGDVIPDLRTLPRKTYPAFPAAGTARYQRITNSRALWALYAHGKLPFHPDAIESDLLAGRGAVYRLTPLEEHLIEFKRDERYGWEMQRLLYKEWEEPNKVPFLLGNHILWQYAADRHASGFATPEWTAPALELPDYRPVTDIWELNRFNWDIGSCLSRRSLETRERLAFRCTLRGWDLAFTAINADDNLQVATAFALEEERLRQYHPLARILVDEVDAALVKAGRDRVHPRPGAPKFSPPPPLPNLIEQQIEPFEPDYAPLRLH